MFATKNLAKWALTALIGVSTVVGTASSSQASPVGGSRRADAVVLARTIDQYHMRFYANEPAVVTVSGDGDTVLRVEIYDEDGNLITTDTDNDRTGVAVAKWSPRWTGEFTIRVRNGGPVSNRYVLRTN